MRRPRRRSSRFLKKPDWIISQPAAVVSSISTTGGSRCISTLLHRTPSRNIRSPCMRVRVKVGLASPLVGDVKVHLGGRQIGVAEHLLDAAQVGAALEQRGGKRVPEEMRVDPSGLKPRLLGDLAQDQESAGARE